MDATLGSYGKCRFVRIGAAFLWTLTALTAALLLYGSFCALTWDKFTLIDYGRYTNMIWNSGDGAPFRMLVDDSYLRTHLSFTLALLGPVFRIWNHPFLLATIQWAGAVAGALLLAITLRHSLSGIAKVLLPPSLAFAFLAHPYTQAVLLCEFHGVGLYLFAIPWLYFTLVTRKTLTALPLIITLGLREDAAFVVMPMLLYFAVRDRWKSGGIYTGLSLLYGVLALKVLFPVVAGVDFHSVRNSVSIERILSQLSQTPLHARLVGLVWVLLPVLPFLRRSWLPVAVLPSTALLLTIASPYAAQYSFSYHYPSAVMACLFPALAEALVSRGRRPSVSPLSIACTAQWLVLAVLIAHAFAGYLPGGGRSTRCYSRIHPSGLSMLNVSRHLPPDGLLVCSQSLAGYVANRADLLSWKLYTPNRRPLDLAVFRLAELAGHQGPQLRALLQDKTIGVRTWHNDVIVLQRGLNPNRNDEVLIALARLRNTVPILKTRTHGGEEQRIGQSLVRHWGGDPRQAGITLAYGRCLTLPAGIHRSILYYRAGPAASGSDAGRFMVCPAGAANPLAYISIPALAGNDEVLAAAELAFELPVETLIEPRVESGTTELWLSHIEFF